VHLVFLNHVRCKLIHDCISDWLGKSDDQVVEEILCSVVSYSFEVVFSGLHYVDPGYVWDALSLLRCDIHMHEDVAGSKTAHVHDGCHDVLALLVKH
jgi:hypothetical protein